MCEHFSLDRLRGLWYIFIYTIGTLLRKLKLAVSEFASTKEDNEEANKEYEAKMVEIRKIADPIIENALSNLLPLAEKGENSGYIYTLDVSDALSFDFNGFIFDGANTPSKLRYIAYKMQEQGLTCTIERDPADKKNKLKVYW